MSQNGICGAQTGLGRETLAAFEYRHAFFDAALRLHRVFDASGNRRRRRASPSRASVRERPDRRRTRSIRSRRRRCVRRDRPGLGEGRSGRERRRPVRWDRRTSAASCRGGLWRRFRRRRPARTPFPPPPVARSALERECRAASADGRERLTSVRRPDSPSTAGACRAGSRQGNR